MAFVRTTGTWRQQGPKLVGAGSTGPAEQGGFVAVAADGNTALVGGDGPIWAFTRANTVWSQLGPQLGGAAVLGSGSTPVALSSDGNTAASEDVYEVSFYAASPTPPAVILTPTIATKGPRAVSAPSP